MGGWVDDIEVIRIQPNGSTLDSSCSFPPYPRKGYSIGGIVTDSGTIILCGGYSENSVSMINESLDKCYKFNDTSWAWEEFQSMTSKRTRLLESMIYYKGVIYVTGGLIREDNLTLKTAEKYENGNWKTIQDLPAPVQLSCLVPINNDKLLSLGGWRPGTKVREFRL